MLYMTAGDKKVIVLESANLDELRRGRPATTPDGSVLIAWTADPVWLTDQILNSDGDGEVIAKLIEEAAKRPEKPDQRPYHKPHVTEFTKRNLT